MKNMLFFFQVMFFLGKFGLCVYMLHVLIHAYIYNYIIIIHYCINLELKT